MYSEFLITVFVLIIIAALVSGWVSFRIFMNKPIGLPHLPVKINSSGGGNTVLFAVGGAFAGQEIAVDGEMILGRDAERCNLVFPNRAPGISSVHCSVSEVSGGVEVKDLKSTFGTFRSDGSRLDSDRPEFISYGESFYLSDRQNAFIVRKR